MLDAAVMTRALEDVCWLDERMPVPLRIAVNLSASEMTHPGLCASFGTLLDRQRSIPDD